jgi:hypothetical protein
VNLCGWIYQDQSFIRRNKREKEGYQDTKEDHPKQQQKCNGFLKKAKSKMKES